MSANNLDRQPEERLITEIKEVRRIATEARTLQSQGNAAINLLETVEVSYSQTVPAVEDFNIMTVSGWLYSSDEELLFAIPMAAFYLDSEPTVPIVNTYQYTVISNPFVLSEHSPAFGGILQSQTLINNSGSPQNVTFRIKWRYIVAGNLNS